LGQISGTGNFQTQVTVRRTCCGNCSEGLTSDKKQTAENSTVDYQWWRRGHVQILPRLDIGHAAKSLWSINQSIKNLKWIVPSTAVMVQRKLKTRKRKRKEMCLG